MKIYLAGEGHDAENIWSRNIRRRLFSYYYHGFSGHRFKSSRPGVSYYIDDGLARGWDMFLDSGAFTAFTKGLDIPLDEYAKFVRWTERAWTVCSSLDAIGSGEEAARKSYNYFTRLRDLKADVCPVFHVREPNHWLQRYIDEGYSYIFIGGMVPETTNWLRIRLDDLWSTILTNQDGTPRVKTHGFGLTDQQLMFRYPWYSVDSSSWIMTGNFGACLFRINNGLRKIVFSDESPEARKFKGWHYKRLPPQSREIVDQWISQFDLTAEQLCSHYSYRHIINAAVFQSLEDLGTDRFVRTQPTLFE